MIDIIDFHTHRDDAIGALIAADPRRFDPQPDRYYTVGFHPWDTVEPLSDDDFALLEQCARHPQVLAIGEAGMDALRGADQQTQASVFVRHLQLAHELEMPVVLHSVRTSRQILDVCRHAGITDVQLVVHGMRGNANVARTWLDAGCFLSFGARFNTAALQFTPLDRLLIETDDAPIPIHEVASLIASALHLTLDDLIRIVTANAQRLFRGASTDTP